MNYALFVCVIANDYMNETCVYIGYYVFIKELIIVCLYSVFVVLCVRGGS